MPLQFLDKTDNIIKNVVFCFTGKSPLPRVHMETIAIKAGATVTKSITKYTTILVIADANSQSTKAQKARSVNIDLISPHQFFIMCDNTNKVNQIYIEKPKKQINPSAKKRHSSVRFIQL